MRKILFLMLTSVWALAADASEMNFQFANPSFSGQGFSSHALTIEQQEFSRRQAIRQQQKAEADAAAAALKNTNLQKFLSNVESRIYAQLSLQLSNAMFSDGSTTGTMNFEGTNISWVKDTTAGTITLTIIDTSNNRTEITVPIGSFKF